MKKWVPQSQLVGVQSGSQPYRRHRASWKALLSKLKENSIAGRMVSQLDAPFSWARVIECCSGLGSVGFKMVADAICCECLWLCISALAFICSSHASYVYSWIFSAIRHVRGFVTTNREFFL